tara:strand:- start:653 stop:3814 length:3162 start_codon:yes stop_codon:yes gene_type:complete
MASEDERDDDGDDDVSMTSREDDTTTARIDLDAHPEGAELVGDWLGRVVAPVELGVQLMQIERAFVLDKAPSPLGAAVDVKGEEFLEAIIDKHSEDDVYATDNSCTVLLFGCTAKGAPMLVRVDDFCPYIYFEFPVHLPSFQRDLLAHLGRVDVTRLSFKSVWRRNMYGWVPDSMDRPTSRKQHRYLKVSFPTVAMMKRAARLPKYRAHEDRIAPETKFLDDTHLCPSGWVSVDGKAVAHNERIFHGAHTSVEVRCAKGMLTPVESPDIAPILVAFVDIECISATMGFPDAAQRKDEIQQIGVNLWRVGTPKESAVKVLFVQPARCGPVDGAYVERFDTEADMLRAFRDMVMVDANPDVLATYNGFGFDLPYMWKRAELLERDDFFFCDRITTHRCKAQRKELSSSALGQNELFLVEMYGRTNLDLYNWIKANEKLDSYKLDAVGEHFLGEKKLDMDYKELFRMARGAPKEIARVGLYCIQDCYLLVLLSIRLQIFAANVEMSRVCHTPMELLVTRGQQIKVVNQLVWYGHRMEVEDGGDGGYIMNTPRTFSGKPGDSYMGATVLEPQAKYYTVPIATLDFMSLYPSIILANNFCFSTLVQDPRYENIPGIDYATIAFGDKRYVWAKNHDGVIPKMMEALLGARKTAKKLMGVAGKSVDDAHAAIAKAEAEGDADALSQARGELYRAQIEKAVYNARQLALKVSANSIYGFTGAVNGGQYACLAVADSVTFRAREMLNRTVDLVTEFTRGTCQVVYGDTDSVMVLFAGVTTVEETAKVAKEAADWITQMFAKATGTQYIVLEFEKVYYPWLLMGKKRYAGLMFEPTKENAMVQTKLDAKGIELVRRDNCALAKRCQRALLDALMYKRDPVLAQELISAELAHVVADEVPIQDYKISKSLRKDYKSDDLPHVHVSAKMAQRQPGSEPQVGDRVPYVLLHLKKNPKAKTFEKAEDIGYVIRNPETCKIDRLYYVEHQIVKPICRLLEHVIPDPTRLFDDTRRELSHQQTGQRSIAAMLGVTVKPREATTVCLEDAMFSMPSSSRAAAPKKRPNKK